MDNRMDNRVHRTPSPGHPLQHGYQLEDNPYGRSQQNFDMPPVGPGRYSPGDSLQMQTAVSPYRCWVSLLAPVLMYISNPWTTCRNTPLRVGAANTP
jgi:hypothetical protein